jgi:hypothetical protein
MIELEVFLNCFCKKHRFLARKTLELAKYSNRIVEVCKP